MCADERISNVAGVTLAIVPIQEDPFVNSPDRLENFISRRRRHACDSRVRIRRALCQSMDRCLAIYLLDDR